MTSSSKKNNRPHVYIRFVQSSVIFVSIILPISQLIDVVLSAVEDLFYGKRHFADAISGMWAYAISTPRVPTATNNDLQAWEMK